MTDSPDDKPITNFEETDTEESGSCNAPNRLYRRLFVYISMAVAWATALFLAKFGTTDIARMVADSMTSYWHLMGVTYILGHSVDRSEILRHLGQPFRRDQ